MIIQGALIIIFKVVGEQAKFLLVKNKETNNISFVSGACENDESVLQTAQREIKEEINLNSDQYDLIETEFKHIFVFNNKKKERAGESAEYQVYLCDLTDFFGQIKPTVEIKKIEWLTQDEVLNKLTFPELKNIFINAIEA